MDRYEALLENYRNAWAGLRMIRDALEELGPVGVLPSQEAVISRYGPEPIHEAQAIVDALAGVLGTPAAKAAPQSPALDSGLFARPAAPRSALHQKMGTAGVALRRERRRHRNAR